LGKLIKYLGEDNICWGTDAMNVQGPQSQIIAMRTFQIPQELIDAHGYKQIDDTIRAKIFGLNAARVFGVDVGARRCAIEGEETAQLKRYLDGEYGYNRHLLHKPSAPKTRREFVLHAKRHKDWPA
jgi:hypothetical protein